MKTVKVTLDLNAEQLHSLLSGFESKWNGDGDRSIQGLVKTIVREAERFDLDDQQFAFETVATAEVYLKLVALVSKVPEIQGDVGAGLLAGSEGEFFQAYERVRKRLGIPDENSAAAIRRRRREKTKQEAEAAALCVVVPFAEVAS